MRGGGVMKIRLAFVAWACFFITGCQTDQPDYSLKPTDTVGQTVRLNPKTNRNYIVSRRENSIVAVGLSTEQSWAQYGRAFDIKVMNAGRRQVEFGASNIDVSSGEQKSQILDYAGVQNAIAEGQNIKQASAMFSAVAGGIGAGLYAGSARSNPVLSSAITQQVMASAQASSVHLASSKAEADVLSDESSKSFLTDVIIPPRGTIGGLILIPKINGPTAEFGVMVGEDKHVFSIASR